MSGVVKSIKKSLGSGLGIITGAVKPLRKIAQSPIAQLALMAYLGPAAGGIGGSAAGSSFLSSAARNAIINAAVQKAVTGEVDLKSALASSAIGGGISQLAPFQGVQNSLLRNALTSGLTSAATQAATGKKIDPKQALLSGALSAGITGLQQGFTPQTTQVKPEIRPEYGVEYDVNTEPYQLQTQPSGIQVADTNLYDEYGSMLSGDAVPTTPSTYGQAFADTGVRDLAKDPASLDTFEGLEMPYQTTTIPKTVEGIDVVPGAPTVAPEKGFLQTRYGEDLGTIKNAVLGEASIGDAAKAAVNLLKKPELSVGLPTIISYMMTPTPEEEESGTFDLAERKSKVSDFLRQYGANFYSGEDLDAFVSRNLSEYKSGGRVGFMMGSEVPVRRNEGGITELDYRNTGGFVPVGVKEKADDVPAMLSKNEFVFTADAVRAAGGGSIEKGAQRMYDTMKQLESRLG